MRCPALSNRLVSMSGVGGQKGQWNGEWKKTTNFDDILIFCGWMWCTYTLSFCFFNIFIFLWQPVGRPCMQRLCMPKSPTKQSQMVTFGLDMSVHKEEHTKCSLVLHQRWRTSSLCQFISCVHSQRVNLTSVKHTLNFTVLKNYDCQ